jgi:hypothetical protein
MPKSGKPDFGASGGGNAYCDFANAARWRETALAATGVAELPQLFLM